MNEDAHVPESETFRIVIPRNGNSEVLLFRDGDRYSLPQVTIPKWDRVARCITERVADLWSLSALCLFQPEIQNKSQGADQDKYFVMESRDPHWCPRADLIWVSRDKICGKFHAFLDADVLQEILEKADCYNAGTLPGPFARPGWFEELLSWAQSHLNARGLRLTGEFRQFNGHPFFNLIRLETNGSAVWFKAVGEPNLHEYTITLALCTGQSQYFPKVIGSRPDWHAWLMQEVHGPTLEEDGGSCAWSNAATTLGKMQVEFAGKTDWLLASGCRDFRIPTVLSKVDPFLYVMNELMQRQPSETPVPLCRAELLELGTHLKDACHQLQGLGIPNSLGHCDLNAGNIVLRNGNRSVFIDCADVYVGHPFPTFEYLRLACRKHLSQFELYQNDLRDAYLKEWEKLCLPEKIMEAFSLSSLLAPLIAALATDRWRRPEAESNQDLAKYLRSLTRIMQREAKKINNSGVTCLIS